MATDGIRHAGVILINRESSRVIFERTGRVARVAVPVSNDLTRAPHEDGA